MPDSKAKPLDPSMQTTQFFAKEGEIHFGIGHPAPNLLPKDLLLKASQNRLSQAGNEYLQYGADAGDGYFRITVTDFLNKHYGTTIAPQNIFISNGISQALDLVCTTFTKTGDTIFVEEPSYFLALHIFNNHKLNIVPVPIDDHGLDIDALESLLATHKAKFVYTIPTHQNPSGATLSQKRRDKLVALAQKHNFLILADEVYHLLSYNNEVPKAMASYIDSTHVISLGSFSKILAPGLRLGWIQTTSAMIDKLLKWGPIQSGGGLNPFTGSIVQSAIELGLQDEYLTYLKTTFTKRLTAMDAALSSLPLSYNKPNGGYFMWLKLPDDVSANDLHKAALKESLNFHVGSKFSSQGGLDNYIRLCFSYYDVPEIEEGIDRLKLSFESL